MKCSRLVSVGIPWSPSLWSEVILSYFKWTHQGGTDASPRTRKTSAFLEESLATGLVSVSDFLEQHSPLSLQTIVLSPPICGGGSAKSLQRKVFKLSLVVGRRLMEDRGTSRSRDKHLQSAQSFRHEMQPKRPAETNHVQAWGGGLYWDWHTFSARWSQQNGKCIQSHGAHLKWLLVERTEALNVSDSQVTVLTKWAIWRGGSSLLDKERLRVWSSSFFFFWCWRAAAERQDCSMNQVSGSLTRFKTLRVW